MTPDQLLAREEVMRELRAKGVQIESCPAEYRVSYVHDRRHPPEIVETMAEAIETARRMAVDAPPAPPPPIGPTGRRKTRKGAMYRHNAKLAARRRRLAVVVHNATKD